MIAANCRSICVFLLFLLVISCKEKSDEVFELKPGTGVLYHFTIDTEEAQARNAGTMPATASRFEFSLQMQKKVDSLQTFNLVIKRISVTLPETKTTTGKYGAMMVTTTGRTFTLSTDDAENKTGIAWQRWYHLVPRLVGDSVKVVVNESGNVYNAWGYETIKNKIVAATGEDPRNISSAIREYAGPEVVTDLVNGLFFYLPGKVVQPGDQWVKNVEFTQKVPVKYSHNITVLSIKEDTVHLSVQTVVSARLGGGKLIAEGVMSGDIIASKSTGMLMNMNLTENTTTHTDNYDVNKKRIFRAKVNQSAER